MSGLYLVRVGSGARLTQALGKALSGMQVQALAPEKIAQAAAGKRLIFAVALDEYGPDGQFTALLRALRQNPGCLAGCCGAIIVDGGGELYTKQAAQELALAANMAGCAFMGKPLVEGTASLYNQHILAKQLGLDWYETYVYQIGRLAARLASFTQPKFAAPRLLMLHASSNRRSNTVWLGRETLARLPGRITTQEICLQNGAIYDCRGCSYDACAHFAESSTCFYGGALSDEVLPAIRESDALLLLCPNYNDAVGANITALFNRLTSLLVRQDLFDKYLFGIVVSGYSGSDLVARQLLGAMCLNKTAMLPPNFCLMQTAHDAGTAQHLPGVDGVPDAFAAHMQTVLLQ